MRLFRKAFGILIFGLSVTLLVSTCDAAQGGWLQVEVTSGVAHAQANGSDAEGLEIISPEDLAALLKAPKSEQPLILNVGPRLLYQQAHIPGAQYMGAASTAPGIEALRGRVKSLPHDSFIVLYCGCCPWSRCPNVRPAYKELRSLGFTKVKLMMIADNFGADWVNKGYPTVKGQ